MEKELKEHLDKLSGNMDRLMSDVAEIKETMATKVELAEVEKKLSAKIDKVDKKLSKKIDDTIEYVKLVDKDVSEHRRNTEMHNKGQRKA